mmetsp:Transcript_15388/g.39082  ORF Transcript_15388/g.39082 Transcript_15388/m.39082 type:complete len:106 (-) Transcript_15388:101-418(-)
MSFAMRALPKARQVLGFWKASDASVSQVRAFVNPLKKMDYVEEMKSVGEKGESEAMTTLGGGKQQVEGATMEAATASGRSRLQAAAEPAKITKASSSKFRELGLF